jgi:hypothetical protein
MGILDILFPASFSGSTAGPAGPHNSASCFALRPRDYLSLRPLAVSQSNATGYLAVSAKDAAYVSTSYAFPAPLAASLERDLFAGAVALALPCAGERTISELEVGLALFRARDLITSVHRACNSSPPLRARAAAGRGPFLSALDVVTRACVAGGALRIVCASVEEVASANERQVRVGGVLYVVDGGVTGGQQADEMAAVRVEGITPAVAAAIAAAAEVPCYMLRGLFNVTSVQVSNFQTCGVREAAVVADAGNAPLPLSEATRTATGVAGSPAILAVTPWECDCGRALNLSEDALRASLRAVGVGVLLAEGRDSLLLKFVDLMDETERREVLIAIAAERDLFGLAGELQAGRSERGKLRARMAEAEDVDELFRLQKEADRLREQKADPTQEPGSYDPYLDQDPWYRPNR